jgi:hypothetical protein
MPHASNTYTIPFNPVCNGPGEFATTKEVFNHQQFKKKRGSRVSPYPSFVDIFQGSSCCVIDGDTFKDLYLADFVEANKRWERV